MNSYEITCIRRSGGLFQGDQDNITHIGYIAGYTRRIITIQQAIQMIQSNQCSFYVRDQSTQNKIWVEVVNQNGLLSGNSYLRTVADGVGRNNLELLPEC